MGVIISMFLPGSVMKYSIYIILLILLPVASSANETFCINPRKEGQNVTEIKANSNNKQLMKLYGVKFHFTSSISSVEVLKTLENTRTVTSQFGDTNLLSVDCLSDNALVFNIVGKLGELKGFYLFKNGFYHAGPLVYLEGEAVIIKSDESVK